MVHKITETANPKVFKFPESVQDDDFCFFMCRLPDTDDKFYLYISRWKDRPYKSAILLRSSYCGQKSYLACVNEAEKLDINLYRYIPQTEISAAGLVLQYLAKRYLPK